MKKKKPIAWEGQVTNIQTNVLLGLAKYRYLTFSMMLRLDIGTKYYQYLWRQVASLRDRRKALVACHTYNTPQPKKGRVESLYFLTNHGKRFLMEEMNIMEVEIRQPTSKRVIYKEYHHRLATISFHISLDKFTQKQGTEITFFDTYFERTANSVGKFEAKTKIQLKGTEYIIPDAAFKIVSSTEETFYLFEMHRGLDNRRLLRQVHQHAKCLTYRTTHGKYNLPFNKAYYIILLFEFESTQNAFLELVKREGDSFKNVQKYFLINHQEIILNERLDERWVTLYGEPVFLF